jgi:hypothetical protein
MRDTSFGRMEANSIGGDVLRAFKIRSRQHVLNVQRLKHYASDQRDPPQNEWNKG